MSDDGIFRDGYRAGDHVLVTGAGGGFGRAFCRRFAKMGLKISAWEIDVANGRETERLVRAEGGEITFIEVDLSQASAIDHAIAQTRAAYGAPYAIVNNASMFPRAPAADMPRSVFETTLAVNVTAPFHISQAFAPDMIAAGRGIIINIASGRAVQGAVNGVSYAASKAAIHSLTKTLAQEWGRHNIRVNTIIPGVSMTAQPLAASTPEQLIEKAKKSIPLGRVGYPEDVAGLAAWLLSSDAAYVTGQGLAINGGNILVP